MLVVTEDLAGVARVQYRVPGAPFANGTEFIAHEWTLGLSALARQALAESVDHGFGEGLAGHGGEFARQVPASGCWMRSTIYLSSYYSAGFAD